jgi:uncharacterized protein (TIGR03382 family)
VAAPPAPALSAVAHTTAHRRVRRAAPAGALALALASATASPPAAAAPPARPGTLVPTGADRGDAGPRGALVWQGPHAAAGPGPQPDQVLYLNRCAGDCELRSGEDDSRTNRSSLVGGSARIAPLEVDDATWAEVVACLRETYAPFAIEVTDQDPGDRPHFETMFGGSPLSLNNDFIGLGVGGVSPFACGVIPNAITFVFDVWGPTVKALCSVGAQESAHAFGLDHELLAADAQSYLWYPDVKRFIDAWAPCGESVARDCLCGGNEQNSFDDLVRTLGLGPGTPPAVALTEPVDGAQVQPGFLVRGRYLDDRAIRRVELAIDDVVVATSTTPPYPLRAPLTLASGPHRVEVRVVDDQRGVGRQAVAVTLGAACDPAAAPGVGCASGQVCVEGRCTAGPDLAGGLGQACADASTCASQQCDRSGDEQRCTEACDGAGGEGCPRGFACVQTSDAVGACWPVDATLAGGGGCASAGGGAHLVVAAAGLGLLGRRRRRRRG